EFLWVDVVRRLIWRAHICRGQVERGDVGIVADEADQSDEDAAAHLRAHEDEPHAPLGDERGIRDGLIGAGGGRRPLPPLLQLARVERFLRLGGQAGRGGGVVAFRELADEVSRTGLRVEDGAARGGRGGRRCGGRGGGGRGGGFGRGPVVLTLAPG